MEKPDSLAAKPISGFLSLFDEQFTVSDFSQAIAQSEQKAEDTLSSARKVARRALQRDLKAQYVVDFEPEELEQIDRGEIQLVVENGETYAQLKKNGKYAKKLPIKKELSKEGVSAEALQMAIQMEAIKKQLQSIIQSIREIEDRVTDVSQGQHNDRIGLFYSGLSLYIESRAVEDVFLKKQIAAQALKAVSDADAQMIQEIRQSISYLVNEQYKNTKKITAKIKEHLDVIHQCYDIVYRATFLKAMIYHESGEIPAMLAVIDEYGRFIEKMIVPYAGRLSELDGTNKFIEEGTWGQIAKTLAGCRDLRKMISNSAQYVFLMGEEKHASAG